MADSRQRTEVLTSRMYPAEAGLVRAVANLHGLSVSEYIRQQVIPAARQTFREMLRGSPGGPPVRDPAQQDMALPERQEAGA